MTMLFVDGFDKYFSPGAVIPYDQTSHPFGLGVIRTKGETMNVKTTSNGMLFKTYQTEYYITLTSEQSDAVLAFDPYTKNSPTLQQRFTDRLAAMQEAGFPFGPRDYPLVALHIVDDTMGEWAFYVSILAKHDTGDGVYRDMVAEVIAEYLDHLVGVMKGEVA